MKTSRQQKKKPKELRCCLKTKPILGPMRYFMTCSTHFMSVNCQQFNDVWKTSVILFKLRTILICYHFLYLIYADLKRKKKHHCFTFTTRDFSFHYDNLGLKYAWNTKTKHNDPKIGFIFFMQKITHCFNRGKMGPYIICATPKSSFICHFK